MNTSSSAHRSIGPLPADTTFPDVEALASMPPPAPLEMPTQSLSRFDKTKVHKPAGKGIDWGTALARVVVFGGALLLTAYGGREMYGVVSVGGVTALEWALLGLFIVNFSWISLALTSAIAGLGALLVMRRQAAAGPLSSRTAVVMPTYNEDPALVFGALAAIISDVAEGPHSEKAGNFDWFVLSDTTDPDIWIAEESVYVDLCRRLSGDVGLYYRHRPRNIARKAGNIADFVTGWGAAYDHMVVLDADSLITADAIVALATAMENDPDAGIIQTIPLVINRNTMFARFQQFAARIYGPVVATGLAAWSGRNGNYWGHNAIVRTRAFASSCGMPTLTGVPPFGGHIMSHDFVEAALIMRAGWAVYMLPHVTGSYEECPPTLVDLAARDRRWCQGNLQHIRVLPAKGLKLASRQHLATGIMSYLASPIWMAQLVVGIILVLQTHYVRPEYFTSDFQLLPAFPVFDAARALQLFGVTMAVLLAPKLFGLLLSLAHGPTRRGCGGAFRMTISALMEVVFSALIAPIMMAIQTGTVFRIAAGTDSGWNPQRRDDGSIPFAVIVRRHMPHIQLGVVTLITGLLIAPSLVAWMSPTIAGLLLAAFLSWGSAQLSAGLALRRVGLLQTPEEKTQPPIVAGAARWRKDLAKAATPGLDGLSVLHENRELRELHLRFLPLPAERHRGDVDVNKAIASAKLDDARSMDDALSWLKPAERTALLLDRKLVRRLVDLPRSCPQAEQRRALE